jgi:hypothetical protein
MRRERKEKDDAATKDWRNVGLKRILFAETTNGDRVARPSSRPVAAWLSLWHDGIYEEVLK